LISLGLIEHRPGIGTFVVGPPKDNQAAASPLEVAARLVVDAFDGWTAKSKPTALANAVEELRSALG
jgi:hypothetical protein